MRTLVSTSTFHIRSPRYTGCYFQFFSIQIRVFIHVCIYKRVYIYIFTFQTATAVYLHRVYAQLSVLSIYIGVCVGNDGGAAIRFSASIVSPPFETDTTVHTYMNGEDDA